MSTADPAVNPDAPEAPPKIKKPLSCVTCKARKLKCDHEKPICTRCSKTNNECIYPESRRKPTLQRNNVKELEARLAQVEGYLKEATRGGRDVSKDDPDTNADSEDGSKDRQGAAAPVEMDDTAIDEQATSFGDFPYHNERFGQSEIGGSMTHESQLPFELPGFADQGGNPFSNHELIDLSMSESLPPFEVIEELHNSFFSTQYHYMPAIHSGRYFQAFHGGPLRKPPMCLQYAIWAMGALWHPKYDGCADVFYKRARQYVEADEMKGDGEYFITVAHAQTWALITCYEARAMLYTRASMSSARCCRLVQILGLNRLDGIDGNLPATLGPAADWIELEERRRVFWVAFSIDAQSSIATGWPSLINTEDIMTRLPASEEAFTSGQEESPPYLDEALKGAPYGGFSGSLILNQILKSIMSHVHLIKPSDIPEDVMNGSFWKRHRRLDNQLSSLFMFMPERFRLPDNLRDPLATYINLNFHASVICLHHVALEVIEKHSLDDSLRKDSQLLLKHAAEEIARIVKMTSHHSSFFSNPLCAFSLYCATTVYVYLAKEDPSSGINPTDMSNLELIINAMEAMGRIHMITCAFLQQACLDIENNGLSSRIKLPILYRYRNLFGGPASSIPLLARSPISKHTQLSSPLPGRLPLDKPVGHLRPMHLRMTKSVPLLTGVTASMDRLGITDSFRPSLGAISRNLAPRSSENANKRKRDLSSSFPPVALDMDSYGTNRHVNTDESTARAGQQRGAPVTFKDPMVNGTFVVSDQSDSSSSFLPLGQVTSIEPASNSDQTLSSMDRRIFLAHNAGSFQQQQNSTPFGVWESLSDEALAFTQTTDLPTDAPEINSDSLKFFKEFLGP